MIPRVPRSISGTYSETESPGRSQSRAEGAERATGSLESPASPRNAVRPRAGLLAAAWWFCVANRAGEAPGKMLSVKLPAEPNV